MPLLRRSLVTLGLFCLVVRVAVGQETPTAVPVAPETSQAPAAGSASERSQGIDQDIKNVEAKIQAIQQATDLDEAVKAKLLESYNRALEALHQAEEKTNAYRQLKSAAEQAPQELQELKAELAQPAQDLKPQLPSEPKPTLAELQQALTQAEADLAQWKARSEQLEAEPRKRAERRLAVPKELTAVRQQLEEVQQQIAAKPAADQSPEVARANQALLEARKKALEAEIQTLEQEPVSYEARSELLTARRDQAARKVAQYDKLVKTLQDRVNKNRREEAEKQAAEARRTAARAHPAVAEEAEENAKLAEQRKELVSKIERATRADAAIDKTLVDLDEQFNTIREKAERVGLTEAIGLLLRRERAKLPRLSDLQRELDLRQTELAHLSVQLIEYEDQRSNLADIDALVQREVKSRAASIPANEDDAIESELRSVLEAQRDLLDSLIADTNTYLDKLIELDTAQHELVSRTEAYMTYIDERILWVRSASPLQLWATGTRPVDYTPSDFRVALEAGAWLTGPANWTSAGHSLWSDARTSPGLYLFAAFVFGLLAATQRRRRTALRQVGEQASRSYLTSLVPTLEALWITVTLALPGAVLLGFLGWRLASSSPPNEFNRAIGSALMTTAVVLLSLEMFRQVCRTKGLGDSHFHWPQDSLRISRGTLWQTIVIGLPLGFVIAALDAQSDEAWAGALGRLSFLAAMAVLIVWLRRVLRPKGGVLQQLLVRNRGGWIDRLKYVWYPASLALPVFLAALAVMGYYYTALQLAWRLLLTLWLVLGLLLVTALILRWLLLVYRSLAIKQSRERRAAAQIEAKEAAAASEGETTQPPVVESDFDLSKVNVQTRKLLRLAVSAVFVLGLWAVWAEVLPALGILRNVELWSTSVAGANGVPTEEPVSLAHVLLALVVGALTVAASRNVPGLLEMLVLQRLPMEPGARFAVTTVCRYTITVVGVVAAFALLGIGWSKVQWLVAAMTVGLGFGLQEIFANFVSGLILLIERPIRVGDIVTVSGTTGKITQIRIRATTVTDWDRKELVIPNKEFVTGEITNWTLSDTIARMTLTVGVAYGSDTELAYKLLLKVAHENPLVLKDPPPHALFDGFGDSTLHFILRVYLPSLDVFLQLRHELHVAIDKAFRNAGIEIAFPQRDLHIRSIEPAVRVAANGALDVGGVGQLADGGVSE